MQDLPNFSDFNTKTKKLAAPSRDSKDENESLGLKQKYANGISPFKFLSSVKEFVNLPEAELIALADKARFETYEMGSYIATEGASEGMCGFILASGSIAMTKSSINGKELIVELLQGGDIFGLMLTLAIKKLPIQMSARALQKSSVLWVPIKNLNNLARNYPEILPEIIAHLIICLQSSYRLSRGLAHDRVEVRIAAILSSLSLKFSDPAAAKTLTLSFTRQQIADLTGTTIETCIRVTRAMQRDGLIDISRPGVIRITNLRELNDLAEA